MIEVTPFASSSRGNAYKITDGVTPLLLDPGIHFRDIQKKAGFCMGQYAGCLISHEHKDHCKAWKEVAKAGIDCYMSQGTAEALGATGHRVKIIKAREQFRIDSWTILPFETQHDAVEPLGFLLVNEAGDKLLCATDTFYIRYRFRRLTHLMLEVNYASDILNANVESGAVPLIMKRRILKSHFSLEHVKEFLRANDLSQVEEIWLIHLSDGNSDAKRFKREIQELTGRMVFVAESN